jgi:biopolymer transport protein ExbD
VKHSDIAHYRQLTALKRHFTSRSRRFPPVIEPAAMVDVVLLILLFFVSSSSYVTRPGVRINLPEALEAEGLSMNAAVVTLTRQGVVFFNDRRIPIDDLRTAFEQFYFERPDTLLVIEADQGVSHGLFMQIHQQAVSAGIRDIAGATRKPATPPSL